MHTMAKLPLLALDKTPMGPEPMHPPAPLLPLKHLLIVAVREALHVGDGPSTPKYTDVTYYTHRKTHIVPHLTCCIYLAPFIYCYSCRILEASTCSRKWYDWQE